MAQQPGHPSLPAADVAILRYCSSAVPALLHRCTQHASCASAASTIPSRAATLAALEEGDSDDKVGAKARSPAFQASSRAARPTLRTRLGRRGHPLGLQPLAPSLAAQQTTDNWSLPRAAPVPYLWRCTRGPASTCSGTTLANSPPQNPPKRNPPQQRALRVRHKAAEIAPCPANGGPR